VLDESASLSSIPATAESQQNNAESTAHILKSTLFQRARLQRPRLTMNYMEVVSNQQWRELDTCCV
jgi:hypothetical protein